MPTYRLAFLKQQLLKKPDEYWQCLNACGHMYCATVAQGMT